MRLAYEEEATFLVEALEDFRERTSVQLAYALQDHEERAKSARVESGS